jgi:hypothetical protein
MLPKLKKSKLGSLLGVVCSICFQNMTLPCKISKQKLAGNAAKHQEKFMENFCVNTENFQPTNMIEKYIFDLSKTNISAEK